MSEYKILVGMCTTPEEPQSSEIEIHAELVVPEFLQSDQITYPTVFAESANQVIAFCDAAVRDLPSLSYLEVAIAPGVNTVGDYIPYSRIVEVTGHPGEGLSVSDSFLLTAYASVAGVDLGIMDMSIVTTKVTPLKHGLYRVLSRVNNDKTNEITDITESDMIISATESGPRWSMSLVGSFDIESDKYRSATQDVELDADIVEMLDRGRVSGDEAKDSTS